MLWKWCSIVYHHSLLTIAMMSGDSYDYVTVSQVCQTVGVPGSSLVNLQGGGLRVEAPGWLDQGGHDGDGGDGNGANNGFYYTCLRR